jgi:hypothetical protein
MIKVIIDEDVMDFVGPIFVTGMPRSGTKLLRDLLNNHSKIAIPQNESLFIPRAIRMLGSDANFEKTEILEKFWSIFRSSKFYANQISNGNGITFEIIQSYDAKTWDQLMKPLFMQCSPKDEMAGLIWGDKTPGYILHLQLLQKTFPNAKFVHIIRDPRDYVCSVKQAWGRNEFRAAERWARTMSVCEGFRSAKSNSYLEVTYEALTSNPSEVLEKICAFLGIVFEPEMKNLGRVTENLGDTKGQSSVVKNNSGKFQNRLSPRKLKRVEEIVFNHLERLEYPPVSKAIKHVPLTGLEMKLFKLHDSFYSLKFHMQQKGFQAGIVYAYRLYRDHSWRNTSAD